MTIYEGGRKDFDAAWFLNVIGTPSYTDLWTQYLPWKIDL